MFNRAVNFVRSNIPDSIAEKAQPYVTQAQDYANSYIEQAQTMGTKIHDYAVNKGSSLKEQSTTYVNNTVQRLDTVLIDEGANKLSNRFLGRELVHFHFKEALEKLQQKNKNSSAEANEKPKDNKETEKNQEQVEAIKEEKQNAATSIANMFTSMTAQVSDKVTQVKESIKNRKNAVTERISSVATNSSKVIPKSYEESRQLAVTAVAGAFTFALKSGQYLLTTGAKYVPETVATRVVSLKDSTVTFATPYLETVNTRAKEIDSKFLKGFTYKFVGDVSKEMYPNTTENKEVVVEAEEEMQQQQEQEQQQQNEEEFVDAVATAAAPNADEE